MSYQERILDALRSEGPCKEGHLFRVMPEITWGEFEGLLFDLEYTDQIFKDRFGNWDVLND